MGSARVALLCWLVLVRPFPVVADGGIVLGREVADGLAVTVFAAPVPLRVGTIDLSVLVQSEGDASAVLDADVRIGLSAEPTVGSLHRAEHEGATNRLLYAALLEAPAAGDRWVHVSVRSGAATVQGSFAVTVAEPVGVVSRFWPWFAMPLVVVLLFLVHQWRVTQLARPRGTTG